MGGAAAAGGEDTRGITGSSAIGALGVVAGNRLGANVTASGLRRMQRGAEAMGRTGVQQAARVPVGQMAGMAQGYEEPVDEGTRALEALATHGQRQQDDEDERASLIGAGD
jgi:hypothetical protein